jgi:hypothetical protein
LLTESDVSDVCAYNLYQTPSYISVLGYRAGSLISGMTFDLRLGKQEWVSVLKLSTIWNIEKVHQNSVFSWKAKFTNA